MKKAIVSILLVFTALSLFANGGKEITVISREEGSGTRGAFVELTGVEEKINGVKTDLTTELAEVANSTSVVITSVQGNKNAIGYISLGSLSDAVKSVSIDGVKPSAEAVKDCSYILARPFSSKEQCPASWRIHKSGKPCRCWYDYCCGNTIDYLTKRLTIIKP